MPDYWGGAAALVFLVPIVAIAGGIVYSIMKVKYRAQERTAETSGSTELRAVIEQSTAINKQLLEKLENLDTRLAGVEKTLNEIP